jgi:IS5 family transposase
MRLSIFACRTKAGGRALQALNPAVAADYVRSDPYGVTGAAAFHEGHDLEGQVEAYRARYGVYPEVVLGDPIYGTRANRRHLKGLGIRFAGKPLGRSKKVRQENREALREEKAKRREEYLQRIPIEGKFGQGKNGYRLNYIRAKRADTSVAWINSIFLVMNLLILLRVFFALCKTGLFLPSLAFAWIKAALSYPCKPRPPEDLLGYELPAA